MPAYVFEKAEMQWQAKTAFGETKCSAGIETFSTEKGVAGAKLR
jgi:hypothetical protein